MHKEFQLNCYDSNSEQSFAIVFWLVNLSLTFIFELEKHLKDWRNLHCTQKRVLRGEKHWSILRLSTERDNGKLNKSGEKEVRSNAANQNAASVKS